MMGVTLTVMRLDSELDRLLARPARSIGLTIVGDEGIPFSTKPADS